MQKAVQPKVTVEKKPKRAGATPVFSAFSRPKSSWGRSRPLRKNRDRVLFACPAGGVAQGGRNHFSVGDTSISPRIE
jgi:hypothetical protein